MMEYFIKLAISSLLTVMLFTVNNVAAQTGVTVGVFEQCKGETREDYLIRYNKYKKGSSVYSSRRTYAVCSEVERGLEVADGRNFLIMPEGLQVKKCPGESNQSYSVRQNNYRKGLPFKMCDVVARVHIGKLKRSGGLLKWGTTLVCSTPSLFKQYAEFQQSGTGYFPDESECWEIEGEIGSDFKSDFQNGVKLLKCNASETLCLFSKGMFSKDFWTHPNNIETK